MPFFNDLDNYELKQLGLDDDEVETFDNFIGSFVPGSSATIKRLVKKELTDAINKHGIDFIKALAKDLKNLVDQNPDALDMFKQLFKNPMFLP